VNRKSLDEVAEQIYKENERRRMVVDDRYIRKT
jgi:hypothetical protein